MKITKTQLRRIIKEEIQKLNDGFQSYYALTPDKQEIVKKLANAIIKDPIDIKSIKKLDYTLLKRLARESDRKRDMAFFDILPPVEYKNLHWALVNVSQFPVNVSELETIDKKSLKKSLKILNKWIKEKS